MNTNDVDSKIIILGLNPSWQKVARISELRFGQLNRIDSIQSYASGKGLNCANVLQKIGHKPCLLSFLGGKNGMLWADDCSENLKSLYIKLQDNTRVCTTFIEKDYRISEIIEPTPTADIQAQKDFINLFKNEVEKNKNLKCVAVCGTFLDGIEKEFWDKMLEVISEKDVSVFLDGVQGVNPILEFGIDVLKINEDELLSLCKSYEYEGFDSTVLEKMKFLSNKFTINKVIVTRGDSDVLAYDSDTDKDFTIAVPLMEFINTVGAGDSFFASMISSFLKDLDFEESLKRAISIACAKLAVVKPSDIDLEFADAIYDYSLKR